MQTLKVIDSHTGGEPTRIIVEGGPNLGTGSLRERLNIFREQFDDIRSAVINEPRGSDVLVGGLLCTPTDPTCAAGIIFFNNTGYLHMCGHGTIGLMVTLRWMKQLGPGAHRIETPVGIVTATLLDEQRVSVQNVSSYRYRKSVTVDVPGHGPVTGDIAWGGNWFFLVSDHGQDLELARVKELTDFTLRIREALESNRITGADGGEIDHIELFGPPSQATADSRNFVLCPGGAYDRSPCGTGTSAKLACLAADGKLQAGSIWRQESIVGSIFEGSWQLDGNSAEKHAIIPTITGSAWVTGESSLILQSTDPFHAGIRS
ncbi:MAG TPA: proline racemase family protein [Planctomycetaceae bacterium]|nr:proline racemase family protein [Planctomycetaceae bacterium]HQZ65396.1 proline racemase family protein [Planctomycetaceae bacterium]